ncbi:unnamed protein product [Schistosoma curassoni]|uniref:t-SNARE coiled-coil homology domain-containing protein n=1 Tax=Schistosoma curassoni TaxID=6186 RepID=A0A183KIJ4_9TREM|nr:unnamed protein product [Schistosoma curassoni]
MIGTYGGNSKPAVFNEFSADIISEIKEITDVSLFSVKFIKYIAIRFAAVICDAPARSSVRSYAHGVPWCHKKLPNLWIDLARRRLLDFNSCAIRDINNLISGTCSDFLRKCRTLGFVSAWKASEYSLKSAKDLLVSLQILGSRRKNTSTDENKLPQFTEKPKRCSRISWTQLETSSSTSESKHVDGATADQLYTVVQNISSTMTDFSKMLQKMSTAITDLSINVKQLLCKSNEQEQPHQFDCGLSSQRFSLSSEEELQILDTGLQHQETRDRFMAMVTRLSSDDPKTSVRYVL